MMTKTPALLDPKQSSRSVATWLIISVLIISLVVPIVLTHYVRALSGNQFNASRIIDDSVFYNGNALSVGQIQQFLNTKVPVCDTNGTASYGNSTRAQYGTSQGYPPPYTCLKDFRTSTTNITPESGICNGYMGAPNETAATIIYKVAQSCSISPKVLLVMLQKEQSLVTDDWPWTIQYEKALGAFCPDTSPCDSGYSGFFKQVYYGANRLKVYTANPTSFNYRAGRNNTIYFHPGPCQTYTNGTCTKYYGNAYKVGGVIRYGSEYASQGPSAPDITYCGSTNVFIANQATANLYIYTPYQPNPAALANLYGTGDICSSYGNRNFWRMYNDWFGTTLFVSLPGCPESTNTTVDCIWRLRGITNNEQYLLSSIGDRNAMVNSGGYVFEGAYFYGNSVRAPKSWNVPVYRLTKPNGSNFLTVSESEKNALVSAGFTLNGIDFYANPPSSTSNAGYAIYRLYSPTAGEHVWVSSLAQRSEYLAKGYTNEGVAFQSLTVKYQEKPPAENKSNVYRFYLQSTNSHFYTTDLSERESLIARGFTYEGVSWSGSFSTTIKPVYRFYSSTRGEHLFTTDSGEKDALSKSSEWKYEGISHYANPSTGLPVYRLYSPSMNKHFWTASSGERDSLLRNHGFISEGVGWTY